MAILLRLADNWSLLATRLMKKFEEIELLLRRTCFRVKVEGRRVLKDFDLTASQFDILQYLYFEGPQRMTQLSEKMGVTKSTMTGLIARLESAEYIVRQGYAKDKRVSLVAITKKGEDIIKKVIRRRVEFIASSLKDVDDSQLLESLRKIYEAISKEFNQLEKR